MLIENSFCLGKHYVIFIMIILISPYLSKKNFVFSSLSVRTRVSRNITRLTIGFSYVIPYCRYGTRHMRNTNIYSFNID
ncbi:hypothetical protein BDF14DRAFT_1796508 [Spinellus fusiger]|nr:hypothetical protein BDF14DRAFT_1796508 [Spinellus fusiger]